MRARPPFVTLALVTAGLAVTFGMPVRLAGAQTTQSAPATSAVISGDTQGVEFSPWFRQFMAQVKRNWVVPSANAKVAAKGHVTVKFVVHKDGRITDIAVAAKSPVDAFNDSARKAIASSNPTTPLPSEYAPEKATFRVTFYYNESPPTPISGGIVGSLPGAPPPPSPSPRAPTRVSGTVRPPTRIKNVDPVYPDIARSAGVEGAVVFVATIGRDGKVVDAVVRKSIPLLDQAARDAVLQWEFTPMTIDGVPAPFVMTLTVNFKLK